MLISSIMLALFAFPFAPASFADNEIGELSDIQKRNVERAIRQIEEVGEQLEKEASLMKYEPGKKHLAERAKTYKDMASTLRKLLKAGRIKAGDLEDARGMVKGDDIIVDRMELSSFELDPENPRAEPGNFQGLVSLASTLVHELAHVKEGKSFLESRAFLVWLFGENPQEWGPYIAGTLYLQELYRNVDRVEAKAEKKAERLGTIRQQIETDLDAFGAKGGKTGKKLSDQLRQSFTEQGILKIGSLPARSRMREAFVGIIIKGNVRTAQGKPLADAIVTWEAPKPTPSDFVAGADPGWDRKKDVQSPPFDTSRDDGSFAVTLRGGPRIVPVRDVPAKDMIVRLDTSNQYIARLKRDTEPTQFVRDHKLEGRSRIISIDPDAGGGKLVIYRGLTDEKKAQDLQDAISKDKRVAFAEPDNCREIQPNGGSESHPPADSTVVAAKDCETMPVVEPVKERPCGAIAGNLYDTRPAARKRIVVYLAADCTRCVQDEARGSYQVTLTGGQGFDPSFLAIPVGSSVVLSSGDVKEIDHDPYVIPALKEDREANRGRTELGLLSKGEKKTVLFSEPGEFMLADFIHKFEDMRVFVTPNTCFAVVADDGTYKISEVPPGAYDIKVWTSPKRTHFPEVPVVVHRGKTTIQDLVLER